MLLFNPDLTGFLRKKSLGQPSFAAVDDWLDNAWPRHDQRRSVWDPSGSRLHRAPGGGSVITPGEVVRGQPFTLSASSRVPSHRPVAVTEGGQFNGKHQQNWGAAVGLMPPQSGRGVDDHDVATLLPRP